MAKKMAKNGQKLHFGGGNAIKCEGEMKIFRFFFFSTLCIGGEWPSKSQNSDFYVAHFFIAYPVYNYEYGEYVSRRESSPLFKIYSA